MRCLLCHKEIGSNPSLAEIFWEEDILCHACRKPWQKDQGKRKLGKTLVDTTWVYNEAFQASLLQYKERYDEALKEIFLYPIRHQFRLKYHGYTLLLLPSVESKYQERGFHHLVGMFSFLGLEILEPFGKRGNEEQKSKSIHQRRLSQDLIYLKEGISFPKKCLLVDDVITSGSTMKGALKLLEKKPIKVKCYACANVIKNELQR